MIFKTIKVYLSKQIRARVQITSGIDIRTRHNKIAEQILEYSISSVHFSFLCTRHDTNIHTYTSQYSVFISTFLFLVFKTQRQVQNPLSFAPRSPSLNRHYSACVMATQTPRDVPTTASIVIKIYILYKGLIFFV